MNALFARLNERGERARTIGIARLGAETRHQRDRDGRLAGSVRAVDKVDLGGELALEVLVIHKVDELNRLDPARVGRALVFNLNGYLGRSKMRWKHTHMLM